MKQKPQTLAEFLKAYRKTYHSSQGGTISAEKQNIVQSPSLPVFRLHHQDRKEKQPCQ